jgi:hypothetical protein
VTFGFASVAGAREVDIKVVRLRSRQVGFKEESFVVAFQRLAAECGKSAPCRGERRLFERSAFFAQQRGEMRCDLIYFSRATGFSAW